MMEPLPLGTAFPSSTSLILGPQPARACTRAQRALIPEFGLSWSGTVCLAPTRWAKTVTVSNFEMGSLSSLGLRAVRPVDFESVSGGGSSVATPLPARLRRSVLMGLSAEALASVDLMTSMLFADVF